MSQPSDCSSDLTTLSFEVMPPRKESLVKPFWQTVDRLLSVSPDFLSVTYGAAGQDRHSARGVVRKLVKNSPVQPIASPVWERLPVKSVKLSPIISMLVFELSLPCAVIHRWGVQIGSHLPGECLRQLNL